MASLRVLTCPSCGVNEDNKEKSYWPNLNLYIFHIKDKQFMVMTSANEEEFQLAIGKLKSDKDTLGLDRNIDDVLHEFRHIAMMAPYKSPIVFGNGNSG